MRVLLTRRQWVIYGTVVLIAVAIGALIACPARAAEKDADFYKRTGTQPPGMGGEVFALTSARYIEDLGLGLGVGYQWKATGIMLSGQITYDRFNAVSGQTPFRINGCTYAVPYSRGGHGHRGVELTFAFPLRKSKP
jgi:hypothetical protein